MIQLERVNLEQSSGKRTAMTLHTYAGILQDFSWASFLDELGPLARKIRAQDGDIVLGLDGPGMIAAIALGELLDLPVRFATKANLARSPKLRFVEPASARPDIYLYGLRRNMWVILADEAVETGDTMASCLQTLQAAGIHVRAVVAPIEAKRYGAREKIRALGYDLLSLVTHDFT